MEFKPFKKRGQVSGTVSALIFLIIGLAVITLIQIFTGTLGGKVYNLVEDDIDDISNTTIKTYIKDGVVASFDASKQTAELTPIVAMAFMIVLILSMIVGLTAIGGMGGSSGGGRAL